MVTIKSTDMRFLDALFEMEGGYVLDFSDRTTGLFFWKSSTSISISITRCFRRKENPRQNDYDSFYKTRIDQQRVEFWMRYGNIVRNDVRKPTPTRRWSMPRDGFYRSLIRYDLLP
jgi:hypothetical protein